MGVPDGQGAGPGGHRREAGGGLQPPREGARADPRGLASAQQAAIAGDRTALADSARSLREGLDYVFYLATQKYLGSDNETGRAEGGAFYLGISPRVRQALSQADATITSAFATGDADAGRGALQDPAVLAALAVDDQERVDRP